MNQQHFQEAYATALYYVATEPAVNLRIGVRSAELATLYEQTGYQSATLVTAFNPQSQQLSTTENQQRHRELEQAVRSWSVPYWPAGSEDPSGSWPTETGLLLLGLSWAQARALGLGFGQNAVVRAGRTAKPELLWCQPATDRCETCGRQVPLTFHHLIPKKLHRRPRFKKHYSTKQLQAGIRVCRTCHNGIHRQFDEMTLGQHYPSLMAIHLQPDLQRHFQWAARQKRLR